MAELKLVGDFETNNSITDCRVWSSCLVNIDDNVVVSLTNNIHDTFKYLFTMLKYTSIDVYYHNLKFDGEFILSYILNHTDYKYNDDMNEKFSYKTLITETGAFYQITLKAGKGKNANKLTFYDSLKIIPLKVKEIAKAFNLPIKKGEINYRAIRSKGYIPTDEENDYIITDCRIVASALKEMFEEGLNKMTIASNAFSSFKKMLGSKKFNSYFPCLDIPIDEEYKDKYSLGVDTIDQFLRKSYKGGYTYVNPKYAGRILKKGCTYDVNSLYPSQMYDQLLPYDKPVFYDGEYKENINYPLYIQRLKCKFKLKKGYNPIIQIKGNSRFNDTEYLVNSGAERVELTVTNIDLEMIKEHYDLYNVTYNCGYMFKGRRDIFKPYIDYWGEKKKNSVGGKRQIAKLMLNSLYGKFATNPKALLKIPYLNEDGNISLETKSEINDKLKDVSFTESERSSIYTAMASFITAYARKVTITAIHENWDRFIYADTDSIHLLGDYEPIGIKVHDKDLGAWAHESNWHYGKFIRPKTYIEDIYTKVYKRKVDGYTKYTHTKNKLVRWNTLDVKCAGMPQSCKKYVNKDNFEIGLHFFTDNIPAKDCRLRPKRVDGGVILVECPFTLK